MPKTTKVKEEEKEVVTTEPTNDDPLSGLSPEARKIFEETQAGLLSALGKEREANTKATERMAALEKEGQERIEKQLQEQGKYKELAEERAKALAEMQPKADLLEAAEAALKKNLDAQIEEIPEEQRSLVPSALSTMEQLEWISTNRHLLVKSKAPYTAAGERGGQETKSVTLTDEQRAMAKKMNVSEEDYAKQIKL